MTIFSIIMAIIAILAIILIHELGHFLVALLCKVKVQCFSVGFGKTLWSRVSKSGIEYRLALLPLGGYVKFFTAEDGANLPASQRQQLYDNQPLYKRFAIVIAGPVTNFILAVALLWVIFMHGVVQYVPVIGSVAPQSIAAKAGLLAGDEITGVNGQSIHNWQQVLMALIKKTGDRNVMQIQVKRNGHAEPMIKRLDLTNWHTDSRSPKFLQSLGIKPYEPQWPAKVQRVLPNTQAARYGLQPGDLITAIDRQPVANMQQLNDIVRKKAGIRVDLTIQRSGKTEIITLPLGQRINKAGEVEGFLGIAAYPPKWPESMLRHLRYSAGEAMVIAAQQTWTLTELNAIVVGKLLVGKISLYSLGGPISIVKMAGSASRAGWLTFLSFVAFVSVTIGFLNLLPIPGLDGGHVLYLLIEAVRRKPVAMRYQMLGFKLGMLLLIFLMLNATINDLIRLW